MNQCWNIVNWNLWNKFSEIVIECHSFSFKKIHMKMSSGIWRPSCLGLNVLNIWSLPWHARVFEQATMVHFLNIFHIGKAPIQKKYNPIKKPSVVTVYTWTFFIPQIIYDVMVFAVWESDLHRYFNKMGALSNWYSPTNETGMEQDCGTDLHVSMLIAFKFFM